MTLQQAAADLHQTFRLARRAKNIQSVGIDETHNRLVVYTYTKEKQPWIYAYAGYPVSWVAVGKLRLC